MVGITLEGQIRKRHSGTIDNVEAHPVDTGDHVPGEEHFEILRTNSSGNSSGVKELVGHVISETTTQGQVFVHLEVAHQVHGTLSLDKAVKQEGRITFHRGLVIVRLQIESVQIDDLITSEHTKMKPVSVSVAVDKKTRMILALEVSKIPAFGHLAKKSRRKYGYRKSVLIKK